MPVQHAADHESSLVHWWPHFGTTEWLQYDFPGEEQLRQARIYFFDDEATGGGCRIPRAVNIQYLENGAWRPVQLSGGVTIVKDGWTELSFEPVKTRAIRLEMTFQDGVTGGVHAFEVSSADAGGR